MHYHLWIADIVNRKHPFRLRLERNYTAKYPSRKDAELDAQRIGSPYGYVILPCNNCAFVDYQLALDL